MGKQFSMNSYLGQRILSLVRDGDYAHAGEEEAIELAMSSVQRDASNIILDAGCGRGGTADYLQRNGWGRVIGIDIEADSIRAARQSYPAVTFLECDVCDVHERQVERPDIICMFNAYYCFKDQANALRALWEISQPHTRMVMFDHVDRGGYQGTSLMDAGEPFLPNPVRLAELNGVLENTGWRQTGVVEVHDAYIRWYASLVGRIERSRGRISEMAGEQGYDHVHGLYLGLLNAAREGKLGAAIITAAPAPIP